VLLQVSAITTPLGPAIPLGPTVPTELLPLITVAGLRLIEANEAGKTVNIAD
jgi:hypothetical protein